MVREVLETLDNQYRNFATLRRAGGYTAAQKAGGTFTPAHLLGASRALDRSAGKGATARGQAAMQRQAQEGIDVFGGSSTPPASMLERVALSPLGLATRPLYGRGAQNWMRGDTGLQHFIADLYSASPNMRAMANALRRYSRPATFGAAVEE
jgi:hypothetical protein